MVRLNLLFTWWERPALIECDVRALRNILSMLDQEMMVSESRWELIDAKSDLAENQKLDLLKLSKNIGDYCLNEEGGQLTEAGYQISLVASRESNISANIFYMFGNTTQYLHNVFTLKLEINNLVTDQVDVDSMLNISQYILEQLDAETGIVNDQGFYGLEELEIKDLNSGWITYVNSSCEKIEKILPKGIRVVNSNKGCFIIAKTIMLNPELDSDIKFQINLSSCINSLE